MATVTSYDPNQQKFLIDEMQFQIDLDIAYLEAQTPSGVSDLTASKVRKDDIACEGDLTTLQTSNNTADNVMASTAIEDMQLTHSINTFKAIDDASTSVQSEKNELNEQFGRGNPYAAMNITNCDNAFDLFNEQYPNPITG